MPRRLLPFPAAPMASAGQRNEVLGSHTEGGERVGRELRIASPAALTAQSCMSHQELLVCKTGAGLESGRGTDAETNSLTRS
jgi:hypothetical protein